VAHYDGAWIPAREKVRRMLARAGIVRAGSSLDHQDLRGWHVLTGGCPGQPVAIRVRRDDRPLGQRQRLRGQLRGRAGPARADTGHRPHRPQSVALLPDRSSQILGAAAAAMLALLAADFDPDNSAPHGLIVAYDLTKDRPGRRRSPA
jgi:hypothetical protein